LAEEPVMAELRDQIAPGAGAGSLLASDADRERVIGALKAAFVQGMLAMDEFDQRVGQTLASRTCAELAALTADLPAGMTAAQPPRAARARLRPGAVLSVATVLYAGVWPLAFYLPRDWEGQPQAAVNLVAMTGAVYLIVWIVAVAHMLDSRRDKRSRADTAAAPAGK
jgi:hypothetical protein